MNQADSWEGRTEASSATLSGSCTFVAVALLTGRDAVPVSPEAGNLKEDCGECEEATRC